MFVFIVRAMAWSDDVAGVLMPSPRGGGGISSGEAEGAMYGAEDSEEEDPQVLVDWE